MRAGLIGGVACVLGFATVASADDILLKEGNQFPINTYTLGDQATFGKSLAVDMNGNFIVVWQDEGNNDGNDHGIFGRRYASDGTPLAGDFQINAYTTGRQGTPSVSTLGDGFVVIWTSPLQDGDGAGVVAQRFDGNGDRVGSEFVVNEMTTGDQYAGSIAELSNGGFVVTWSSGYPVRGFAKIFDSDGQAVGPEFQVDDVTSGNVDAAMITPDPAGGFVAAWATPASYPDVPALRARHVDDAGVLGAPTTILDTFSSGSMAAVPGHGFIVVWGDPAGLTGRFVSADLASLGAPFAISSYATGNVRHSTIGVDTGGDFVVSWDDYNGRDGDHAGVFARAFNAAGVPTGGDQQINTATAFDQNFSRVAAIGDDRYVAVWSSWNNSDGNGAGVYGQLLSLGPEPPPPPPTPTIALVQPNGGEVLKTGSPFPIRWTTLAPEELDHINVAVSTNNGVSFEPIAECQNLAATATECVWQNPGPVAKNKALVRVTGETPAHILAESTSSFAFSIQAGVVIIKVSSPNTSLTWPIGAPQLIKWTHNLGINAHFRIALDRDNDGTYEEAIANDVPSWSTTTGQLFWTINGPASLAARIQVSWVENAGNADASNVPFAIAEPLLSFIVPKAGANWAVDSEQSIKVKHNLGSNQYVDLQLDRDGDGEFEEGMGSVYTSGSIDVLKWTVTGPATLGDTVRLRALWNADQSVFADSQPIHISGSESITVTSPNTPVNWGTDSVQPIKWNHNMGIGSSVKVELDREFPSGNWELLNPAFTHMHATNGVFNWTVTGPVTSSARIRVTNLDGSAGDLGNTNFTISEDRFLTVNAPGTPATWTIGSKQKITWSHNLPAASKVAIELDRDGDSNYETLLKNNLNAGATGGTFTWTVTGPATEGATATVRVRWTTDADVSDSSDVAVTIAP